MAVNILHVNDRQCRIEIEGEMTIYNAMQLKEDLLPPLLHYKELDIDLAKVSEFDSSGLQLLMMAKIETVAKDRALRITAHSPSVLELLSLCDLESFFGDPVVISSQE